MTDVAQIPDFKLGDKWSETDVPEEHRLRYTRIHIHYVNYPVDEDKQPVCMSCEKPTNWNYREEVNMKCWNCGEPLQRHPFDSRWVQRMTDLLAGKYDSGPMEPYRGYYERKPW